MLLHLNDIQKLLKYIQKLTSPQILVKKSYKKNLQSIRNKKLLYAYLCIRDFDFRNNSILLNLNPQPSRLQSRNIHKQHIKL